MNSLCEPQNALKVWFNISHSIQPIHSSSFKYILYKIQIMVTRIELIPAAASGFDSAAHKHTEEMVQVAWRYW